MKKPFYYEKQSRGRNSREETALIEEINSILESNPALKDQATVAKNVDELKGLRDSLSKNLEGSASAGSSNPVEDTSESGPDFNLDPTPETPTTTNSNLDNSGIFDDFDMFEPIKSSNPFDEAFNESDMFKIDDPLQQIRQKPDATQVEPPAPAKEFIQSAPNAWEMDDTSITETTEEVSDAVEHVTSNMNNGVEKKFETPELSKKVQLEEATKKKATSSMAKVAAKMISFATELGGQYIAKYNPKELHRMSKEGLIDLHEKIGDKTISQIVNEHNDAVPEIIKNDPELIKDLENAIKLVMEGRSIEVTPEQNLAAVAVMMLFQLIQAGMEHKRHIKTLIKQTSDNYLLNLEKVKLMQQQSALDQEELERLRLENKNLMTRVNQEQSQTEESQLPVMSFKTPDSDKQSDPPKRRTIKINADSQGNEKDNKSKNNSPEK